MAGILANSASQTMVSTTADETQAGYVTDEQIALTVGPAATTSYLWTLSVPGTSTRCSLDDDDVASPHFTPDVAGEYVAVCLIDGTTTYVLRLSVSQVSSSTAIEAIRHTPKRGSTIQTPSLGSAVFHSYELGALAFKTPSGTVFPLFVGKPGASLVDGNQTLAVGSGNHYPLPSGTLTGNQNVTLGTTGAGNGDFIAIYRYDTSSNSSAIINGGAGAGTKHTFTGIGFALFLFDGTNWSLHMKGPLS